MPPEAEELGIEGQRAEPSASHALGAALGEVIGVVSGLLFGSLTVINLAVVGPRTMVVGRALVVVAVSAAGRIAAGAPDEIN